MEVFLEVAKATFCEYFQQWYEGHPELAVGDEVLGFDVARILVALVPVRAGNRAPVRQMTVEDIEIKPQSKVSKRNERKRSEHRCWLRGLRAACHLHSTRANPPLALLASLPSVLLSLRSASLLLVLVA